MLRIAAGIDLLILRFRGESKIAPQAADPVLVTGAAGAWAFGAYATILPSASSPSTGPWVVDQLHVRASSAVDYGEIELAYGDAGSEIVFARVPTKNAIGDHPVSSPMFNRQTRISARYASTSGGADTLNVAISYKQTPLD